jgi:hypothetical protein
MIQEAGGLQVKRDTERHPDRMYSIHHMLSQRHSSYSPDWLEKEERGKPNTLLFPLRTQ